MCGIAGIFSHGTPPSTLHGLATAMAETLHHRGPDMKGVWVDDTGVGLGFARLSIIDLSQNGAQPMASNSGRWVIAYNGEIYNFKELAEHLTAKGISLKGHSDTEVLVECINEFGLDWTLQRAHGMFAISLWDREERRLTLARDRFGEKPLYYGTIEGDFLFASELKCIRKHPKFSLNVDRTALSAFVKYNYVPSPLCILEGFKKLMPGTVVSGTSAEELMACEPVKFWSANPLDWKEAQEECSIDQFEEKLTKVIERQMISDVPLGSFLSGGVDSSLITAIAQSISDTPVKTFTIGFPEEEFDESRYAKEVAKHLGTEHTEWVITQQDVLDLVPSIASIYDEPFGDESQLPTSLLAKMTKKSVTVCLSGDGGDELFGGYSRYEWAEKANKYLSKVPKPLASLYRKVYSMRDVEDWVGTYEKVKKFSPLKMNHIGDKLEKLNTIMGQNGTEIMYEMLLSHWHKPSQVVIGGVDYSHTVGTFHDELSLMENMMLHDAQHYLVDDIMVKVDRAGMAASLESRAPFLDHELYEAAWSMPMSVRRKGGVGKYPLKEILYRHVPQHLIDRPKKGFGVPLAEWYRHDLKEWVCDSLDATTLKQQGYFDSDMVTHHLNEHMSETNDRNYHLWDILVFQEWLKDWTD